MSTQSPIHTLLFTIPRTASNLATQLLNLPSQPGIHRHPEDGYIFLPALIERFKHDLPGKSISDWTPSQKAALKEAFAQSFTSYTAFLATASAEGKSTYIKEHINWLLDPISETSFLDPSPTPTSPSTYFLPEHPPGTHPPPKDPNNVTCLPDAFLLRDISPTFLIRHPALTFPSALRNALSNQGPDVVLAATQTQWWECTYRWTRALWTFYATTSDSGFRRETRDPRVTFPIVLDAGDLGDEGLVRRYAEVVGLEGAKVRFGWEAEGLEGVGRLEARMKDTLLKSTGVIGGKLRGDLQREKEGWREEFGEVLAGRLEGLVEEAMGDYEFLRGVRFRG
ncbi:hypothetical protein BS50DRAFT_544907 [Corynespora cassiicola Philippines]|uniref:P-loop containing nucleoside triphosphate hydrolase protein n=1 Tax=Corynespora cassiicola Philippines TaxID=1448308 RepID=A0A2T2P401_CORCC|nr:hypothetical protein BS50DRAFT_544907 [Corynespora cassiicola Philippines]